nr:hypothetical protein [uncultured Cohaesibacter sp.]
MGRGPDLPIVEGCVVCLALADVITPKNVFLLVVFVEFLRRIISRPHHFLIASKGLFNWPDLAEDRLSLDCLGRNGSDWLSSPSASRHSSRNNKATPFHPPLCFGRKDAAAIVFGLLIAIETAWCGIGNKMEI